MMMKSDLIISNLDKMIPNPRCELEYNKDYELLLATVLSAQCKKYITTLQIPNKYNELK